MTLPDTPRPGPTALEPRPPAGMMRTAARSGLGGLTVGLLTELLSGNLAAAIVAGFFAVQGLTWIARTSGRERRAAIAINLTLALLLGGSLAVAFNAGGVLRLLGVL